MTRTCRLAMAVFAGSLLVATGAPAADPWGDYAGAWLAEQLPRDRYSSRWTDLVARPGRSVAPAGYGPRTWDPSEQNPWANTFGTPTENRRRATTSRSWGSGVVRLCSCYLPADARSWDGGPLTDADITRLCRAQCY